ncbi:hypothetical protein [Paenibacillus flagellatus]|uniref:Uncharacterized protein n=1 Tax=Paenibacillus flagellatus TaxID=2211139 RepID=A0A2V5K256_9BACL|nr:hypothetical protein [Paenibacillus flagellatus]PYI51633.1 hypothetical protein DLM86_24815 [Paenibacillus flagellatus]
MYVISTFEHSLYVELAISDLERMGMGQERIFVVSLEKRSEPPRLFDTIHRSDGVSLLDLAAVLGTAFSVLGASFGFRLTWGPIIWGLIGLAFGALVGFLIDWLYHTAKNRRQSKLPTEVVLIVECISHAESEAIKKLLWDRLAIGVAVTNAV